jgi:hypothetical protein
MQQHQHQQQQQQQEAVALLPMQLSQKQVSGAQHLQTPWLLQQQHTALRVTQQLMQQARQQALQKV